MTDEQTTSPEETAGDTTTTPPAGATETPPPASDAASETWGEPLPWDDLVPASVSAIHSTAADAACAVELIFLQRFGSGPLDPDAYGLFGIGYFADVGEVVRYILERRPSAETLCIRIAELLGDPTPTPEDIAGIIPAYWAQLELAVRLIPAVADTLEAVNAEISRRRPPDPPPPAAPIPIEETSLEQMPGFGERMEG